MSRILFAWELGGGLGRIGPFRPIAERLAARGHEITVAARDVERAHSVFDPGAVKVAAAPVCVKTYTIAERAAGRIEALARGRPE